MASVNLSTISGTKDIHDLINAIERQRKDIEFLLENLDDDNIKEVSGEKVVNLTIDQAQIKNLLVDTANIKDLAVSSAKIANAAITYAHIQDAAIGNAKIDRASVNKLVVVSADIQDAAITNAKIKDAAITTAKIGDAQITSAKIQQAQIISAHIADAQILTAHIADAQITTAKIASAAIETANIKDASITTAKIGSAQITTGLIADAAITTALIADLAVSDAKIVSITANKLTAGTIDASKINVTNLVADNIVTGTITIASANLFMNTDARDIASIRVGNGALVKGQGAANLGPENGSHPYLALTQSTTGWMPAYLDRVPLKGGQTVTITGYYTHDSAAKNAVMYLLCSDTLEGTEANKTNTAYSSTIGIFRIDTPSGTGWTKFSKTVTLDPAIKSGFIRFDHNGSNTAGTNSTVRFAAVMVQYGNISTKWQPHTNEMLAEKGITNLQIGDSAVDNRVITANTITGDRLVVDAITTREIKAGSITAASGILANLSVGTANIIDGAISTVKIGDAQITSAKIKELDASVIKSGYIDAARIKIGANVTFDPGFDPTKKAEIQYNWLMTGGVIQESNGFRKASGTANTWDGQAYTKEGYTGGASLTFNSTNATSIWMMGLNTDPATDAGFGSIDYAYYINNGTVQIYEGTAKGTFGTCADGDTFSIVYDGDTVKYYHNGQLDRTVTAGPDKTFYVDSSFYDVESVVSVKNIIFSPIAGIGGVKAAAETAQTTADSKVSQKALQTANTGGTYGNQWTKIGTVRLITQYQYFDTDINFTGGASGANSSRWAQIHFRVKQQNAMGSVPFVLIDYIAGSYITPAHFKAVTVTNTAAETKIELYVYINATYEQYGFTPTNIVGNTEITWHESQSFVTALPTGTQTAADDKSHYPTTNLVDGWKYPGTTYIDGGDIYTNSITANQIAAGAITTNHIDTAGLNASVIKAGTIDAARIRVGATTTFDSGYHPMNTDVGYLTKNPVFAEWPSGNVFPIGFGTWSNSPTRENTLSRNGGNAMRFKVTDAATQAGTTISGLYKSGYANNKYLVVELDFYLVSGSPNGAGVLIDWNGMSPYRTQWKLQDMVPETIQVGKWYSVRKLFKRPTDTLTGFTSMAGYLMGNYSSLTNAVKDIIYDRFAIREATSEEIVTDGWKYLNTTEIDGGNIRTGTVDANVLKANTVIADNIKFTGVLEGATGTFSGDITTPTLRIKRTWGTLYGDSGIKLDTGQRNADNTYSYAGTVDFNSGNKALEIYRTGTDGTRWALDQVYINTAVLQTSGTLRATNNPEPIKIGNLTGVDSDPSYMSIYSGSTRLGFFGKANSAKDMWIGADAGDVKLRTLNGSADFTFTAKESYNHAFLHNGTTALKLLKTVATLQVRNAADSAYGSINASDFTPASRRSMKKNIVPYEADALSEILSTPVYQYHYLEENDLELKHTGLIYEESPVDAIDPSGTGMSLYGMASMTWRGMQQINTKLEEKVKILEARIAALEGKAV